MWLVLATLGCPATSALREAVVRRPGARHEWRSDVRGPGDRRLSGPRYESAVRSDANRRSAKASSTARSLALTLGGVVRRTRLSLRATQSRVGEAAGISQSAVSLIERGRLTGVSLQVVADLCDALEIHAGWNLGPPLVAGAGGPFGSHLAPDERQRDRAHARCTGYIRRRLEQASWTVAQEVEVVTGRSHGWIDILAFDSASGTLLVGEVKTELRDIGAIQRVMAWYQREGPSAAHRRGWRARHVVSCLFILETEENDQRITQNRELLGQAFPARSRAVAPWLAGPSTGMAAPAALVMFDPTARRRVWVRGARVDGRRSAAPFADYRAFVKRLEAR